MITELKNKKRLLCKDHVLIKLYRYYLDNNNNNELKKCSNTYTLINNKNIIFSSIEYEFKIIPSNTL